MTWVRKYRSDPKKVTALKRMVHEAATEAHGDAPYAKGGVARLTEALATSDALLELNKLVNGVDEYAGN